MEPNHDAAKRFAARAREKGLDIRIVEHGQSTRSAEEAAAVCGCEVSQIVKSLVFRGRRSARPYLLLVAGHNRVDEAGVAQAIGEPLVRPDARFVRNLTGYAIGGIPPLGHDTPIVTFMDHDLLAHARVWAAAGTPKAVFVISPHALAAACGASVIAVG